MSDIPAPPDAQQLMSRMMRKELYVVSNRCLVEPGALQSALKDHLDYLIELEKGGVLFASGPLFDESGTMTGDGITILRAASFDDATTMANRDPFVTAGLRQPHIRRWLLNEGRITVSVDLSDCGGMLP